MVSIGAYCYKHLCVGRMDGGFPRLRRHIWQHRYITQCIMEHAIRIQQQQQPLHRTEQRCSITRHFFLNVSYRCGIWTREHAVYSISKCVEASWPVFSADPFSEIICYQATRPSEKHTLVVYMLDRALDYTIQRPWLSANRRNTYIISHHNSWRLRLLYVYRPIRPVLYRLPFRPNTQHHHPPTTDARQFVRVSPRLHPSLNSSYQ